MNFEQFSHYTVMKNEAVNSLNVKPCGIYVDATLGGGGHSLEIVKKLDVGRLIAIDRDAEALEYAKKRLCDYRHKIFFVKDNYCNAAEIIENLGYEKIDGVLIDLGVSTFQIAVSNRGFSYMQDARLDMRMDKEQALTAKIVINQFERDKLKEILYKYGEEKYSSLIVEEIIKCRKIRDIETTAELVGIIKNAVKNVRYSGGHPAKRTFQAVRIYVNNELGHIEPALDAFIDKLNSGGRISVISFHSLEDRVVKKCFNKYEKGCECPPAFPICICSKKPVLEALTRKPIYPSKEELAENSNSGSAKMRVAEKL